MNFSLQVTKLSKKKLELYITQFIQYLLSDKNSKKRKIKDYFE